MNSAFIVEWTISKKTFSIWYFLRNNTLRVVKDITESQFSQENLNHSLGINETDSQRGIMRFHEYNNIRVSPLYWGNIERGKKYDWPRFSRCAYTRSSSWTADILLTVIFGLLCDFRWGMMSYVSIKTRKTFKFDYNPQIYGPSFLYMNLHQVRTEKINYVIFKLDKMKFSIHHD